MVLTQTSDGEPFIVCAIPDHRGDLDPRTIEARVRGRRPLHRNPPREVPPGHRAARTHEAPAHCRPGQRSPRETITRRPYRGPVAHPGNLDARDGHTELEQCTHCGALRVVNLGPSNAREAAAWTDPAPHFRSLAGSELYRVLVGPQREEQR